MMPIGNYSIVSTCSVLLGLSFATFSTLSFAHSDGRIWLVGEPSPGMPPCEEFYDKWEAPGAPPGLLAMAGYSREVFAAKDCLDKNNAPMACKHWQGLLVVMDKLGLPLSEGRSDIEELLRQNKCDATPASDSKPAPKSRPSSEEVPAKPAPETGPSPAPDPDPKPGPTPAE